MDIEVKDKANRRHVGHNLQKIRVYSVSYTHLTLPTNSLV